MTNNNVNFGLAYGLGYAIRENAAQQVLENQRHYQAVLMQSNYPHLSYDQAYVHANGISSPMVRQVEQRIRSLQSIKNWMPAVIFLGILWNLLILVPIVMGLSEQFDASSFFSVFWIFVIFAGIPDLIGKWYYTKRDSQLKALTEPQ